jgi:DNA-binding NarL/FixJ family response regulator
MRLLLVGPSDERQRLRAEIEDAALTIAGEFATLADARASGIEADAILMADLTLRQAQGHPEFRRGMRARQLDDEIEEPLTPREVEVVELLAEGLSNKAIAARLGISDQTVKFHVASISGKLGAANRTDAVRRAVRRGLISL